MENIAWYYEVDGACIGPVTQEVLCHLLRTGSIGPATRVRCEALPDWMLAAQVPGFQAIASPPPLPGAAQPPQVPGTYLAQPDPIVPTVLQGVVAQHAGQQATLPTSPPTLASLPGAPVGATANQPNFLVWDSPAAQAAAAQAAAAGQAGPAQSAAEAAAADAAQGEAVMLAVRHASASFESSASSAARRVNEENVPQIRPWVRFWARGIDAMVAGLAFAICCLGWAALAGPMGKWTFLLSVGFFLLWVFVEAFMLSEMGTTVGKAVLGVTVRNEDGNDLTYGQALARGFRVLYRGLAFGIPVVNLVALIVSYFRLTGNGSTSWDRDGRLTVSHSRVGFVRGITAFVCIIGLYGMTIFASSIAASATDPGAPIVAAAATAPAVPVATIPSITIPPAAAPAVALPPPPPPPIQISSPKPNRRTPAKRKTPAAVAPKGNTAGAPAKSPARGAALGTVTRTRGAARTETASAAPTAPSVDQDPNSSSDGKIMIIRKTR